MSGEHTQWVHLAQWFSCVRVEYTIFFLLSFVVIVVATVLSLVVFFISSFFTRGFCFRDVKTHLYTGNLQAEEWNSTLKIYIYIYIVQVRAKTKLCKLQEIALFPRVVQEHMNGSENKCNKLRQTTTTTEKKELRFDGDERRARKKIMINMKWIFIWTLWKVNVSLVRKWIFTFASWYRIPSMWT